MQIIGESASQPSQKSKSKATLNIDNFNKQKVTNDFHQLMPTTNFEKQQKRIHDEQEFQNRKKSRVQNQNQIKRMHETIGMHSTNQAVNPMLLTNTLDGSTTMAGQHSDIARGSVVLQTGSEAFIAANQDVKNLNLTGFGITPAPGVNTDVAKIGEDN